MIHPHTCGSKLGHRWIQRTNKLPTIVPSRLGFWMAFCLAIPAIKLWEHSIPKDNIHFRLLVDDCKPSVEHVTYMSSYHFLNFRMEFGRYKPHVITFCWVSHRPWFQLSSWGRQHGRSRTKADHKKWRPRAATLRKAVHGRTVIYSTKIDCC